MRTSGGTGGFVKPAAGRLYMISGESAVAAAAATAGVLRLYAIANPFAVAFTALGVNVTAAGAAGSTLTPVFYDVDASGNPRNPVVTGPALDTSVIAQVNGAQAGVIPAGNLWVGTLCLSAGAGPTVTSVSKSDHDPRGPWSPTDNAAGAAVLAAQSGLAAVPTPFAGLYNSGFAPVVYVTT